MGLPMNIAAFMGRVDTDAQAFLYAASITDSVIVRAVNNLVRDLKMNGLWSKFYALYPIVGGTSTTHKFNLKSPLDTDAAYRLTFSGGITHSSTGMLGNGTTGYANTNFTPSSNLVSINDAALMYYSRTNSTTNGVDIGVITSQTVWDIEIVYIPSTFYGGVHGSLSSTYLSVSNTTGNGLFVNSRTASNAIALYRNAVSLVTGTMATGSISNSNKPIYLLARNDIGTAAFFSVRECAFAGISTGLAATEVGILSTIISNFQTTLGR